MLLVLVGGGAYLYVKNMPGPPPPPPPEPPPALSLPPPSVIHGQELERVRMATRDTDPQVRWGAIELLHRVRDPKAYNYLRDALAMDTEAQVRLNALQIIAQTDHPDRAKDLTRALRDTEQSIRIAALQALGQIAEPQSAPAIVRMLSDTEAEVRRESLQALARIQERRDAEHQQMQEEVRRAYEEALAQAKAREARGMPVRTTNLIDKSPQ